jgi:hypothetical protein
VAPNILVISQGEKRRSAAVLVGDAGLEPATCRLRRPLLTKRRITRDVWWAMQGSNLRPSGCKASEPERCASDSAPLSENAEVISWKMGY